MAKIQITKQHALGLQVALSRAQALTEKFEREGLMGQLLVGHWAGNRYVLVSPASGTAVVDETAVHLDVELSGAIVLLKHTIAKQLDIELEAALRA